MEGWEPKSNFDKFVMGQTMGKMHVVSVHLWLEYMLTECLKVVVPDPKPLFRGRGLSFAQLVSLCEAHQIIDKSLARVLRHINGLRNKCAHDLEFNPKDDEWSMLDKQVEFIVTDMQELRDVDSLQRLSDHVEHIAIEMGALKSLSA